MGLLLGAAVTIGSDCPELAGRWPRGPAYWVAVSNGYAYVGDGTVLQVVDVSEPTAPRVVGEVELPDLVARVVVVGPIAYVANHSGGLRIIDVSTPSMPFEVGFSESFDDVSDVAV